MGKVEGAMTIVYLWSHLTSSFLICGGQGEWNDSPADKADALY